MGRVIRAQKKGTAASVLKSQTPVIGAVLPLGTIPAGTIVCNVKNNLEDDDVFIRSSRDYAKVISHNPDKGTSRIKLPSGAKKIVPSGYVAMIKQVIGEDRTEKPLKAENANKKFHVKRHRPSKLRSAEMNPVEHPHQHVGQKCPSVAKRKIHLRNQATANAVEADQQSGDASTVPDGALPGYKVDPVASRRKKRLTKLAATT